MVQWVVLKNILHRLGSASQMGVRRSWVSEAASPGAKIHRKKNAHLKLSQHFPIFAYVLLTNLGSIVLALR